jgi:hypothetical protein
MTCSTSNISYGAHHSRRVTGVETTLPVIVTVIEAGPLERQVCLLVESLRRWGGRLAATPVVAVKPRRGPELSRTTKGVLDGLDVQYWAIDRDDGFEWFPYLNKTTAVKFVAARHQESTIWLDADILIVGEPSELLLNPNNPGGPEFVACAPNKNIGTSRDDDDFAPYFIAACTALGVNFSSLPYVLTEDEHVPIRAYWNSGVYAFSNKTGFADLHHDFTLSLVARGIASHESNLFFSDQVSLGLAAHHLGLRYRNLPLNHNFSLQPQNVLSRLTTAGGDVRILHYHGCMWPSTFGAFCAGLEVAFPEVADWLRSKGALTVALPPAARFYRKILEFRRKRQSDVALRKALYY